ncbi:MAG: hypothetical protein V1779_03250 [bacterium]
MGQILNRVLNLAKAKKVIFRESCVLKDTDDDELKRIIDDLNSSDFRQQTADGRQQTGERRQKSEDRRLRAINN